MDFLFKERTTEKSIEKLVSVMVEKHKKTPREAEAKA